MALRTYDAMMAVEDWIGDQKHDIPDEARIFPHCLHDGDGRRALELLLAVEVLPRGDIRYFHLARLILRKGDERVRVGEERIVRVWDEIRALGNYEFVPEVDYAGDRSIERVLYSEKRPPPSLFDAYERVTGGLVEWRKRLEAPHEARMSDPLAGAHRETAFLCEWIAAKARTLGIPDPITGAGSPTTSVPGNGRRVRRGLHGQLRSH